MKISVVIATYNGQKYLLQQLDSIRNQTLSPDEVIICDDCSTDLTYQLIEDYVVRYSLEEWRLYRNKVNKGYIDNFYRAISLSTGDLIFLCDQDDIWISSKIEKMSRIIYENPSIKVLTSAYQLIDASNTPFTLPNSNNKDSELKSNQLFLLDAYYLFEGNNAPGCTCCFTSEIREMYLADKNELTLPHDYLINILGVQKHGSFYYNQVLTKYRIHSTNTIGIETNLSKSEKKRRRGIYYKQYRYQYLFDILNQYFSDQSLNMFPTVIYLEKKLDFYKKRSLRTFWEEIIRSRMANLKNFSLYHGSVVEFFIDFFYLLHYQISNIKKAMHTIFN